MTDLLGDLLLRIESAVRQGFGMKLTPIEAAMLDDLLRERLPLDVLASLRKRTIWQRLFGRGR